MSSKWKAVGFVLTAVVVFCVWYAFMQVSSDSGLTVLERLGANREKDAKTRSLELDNEEREARLKGGSAGGSGLTNLHMSTCSKEPKNPVPVYRFQASAGCAWVVFEQPVSTMNWWGNILLEHPASNGKCETPDACTRLIAVVSSYSNKAMRLTVPSGGYFQSFGSPQTSTH